MESHPGERIGHIANQYKDYMLIWGGYHGYNYDMQTDYLRSDELWIYDSLTEKWFRKKCVGERGSSDVPPGTSGASACIISDCLYLFGGYNDEEGNSNNLYRLDLKTLKWKLLEPTGLKPLPCDKSTVWEYNQKFYIFAGYGCGPYSNEYMRQSDYEFILDLKSHWHYRRGWNNQFVCYDPEKNEWKWPSVRGRPPIARAAHAAARVNNKVYILGGRHGQKRMSDLYYIDMDSFTWSDVLITQGLQSDNTPVGRSWHTFTRLSEEAIVLYGGFSQHNKPLNDCWILNICTLTWTEILDIKRLINKPRLWHTATISPFGEILVFGGGTQNILSNFMAKNIYSGDVITLRFSPKSLLRLCLDSVIEHAERLQKQWIHLPLDMQHLLDIRKQVINANIAGS